MRVPVCAGFGGGWDSPFGSTPFSGAGASRGFFEGICRAVRHAVRQESDPRPGALAAASQFAAPLISCLSLPLPSARGVSLVDDSPWRRSPAAAGGVATFRDGV